MAEDKHKENVVYTTDLMTKPPSMSSFSEGKEGSRVPLVKGPAGFLVAKFGDLVQTSEYPNVVLDTLEKKTDAPGEGGVQVGKRRGRPPGKKTPTKALGKKTPTKALGKKKVAKKQRGSAKTPTTAAKEKKKKDEPPEQEKKEKSRLFGVMYYKNNHFIGIRAKTGDKNQVVSFGGKAAKDKTKEQMVEIGRQVCLFMDEGRSVEEAKAKAATMLAL